jgi:hypothetical protein
MNDLLDFTDCEECLDESLDEALEQYTSDLERKFIDVLRRIGLSAMKHVTFVATKIVEMLETGESDGSLEDICEGGLMPLDRHEVDEALDLLERAGWVRVSHEAGDPIVHLIRCPSCL